MMPGKNIKIFLNYFLGPVLFTWLSWSVYRQIRQQPDLELSWYQIRDSFSGIRIGYLFAVMGLMIANWSLEAVKWKQSVIHVEKVSFFTALKAVLSGVSFSVTMPNRVGEYLGRILYMKEGNRLRTISLTILCSISQLLITLLAGITGLLFIKERIYASEMMKDWNVIWVQVVSFGTVAVFLITLLFYFRVSLFAKWIDRLPKSEKYSYLIAEVGRTDATLLFKLLSLSAVRFCVFTLQYYLLFCFFDVDLSWWQCFQAVSVLFLVLTVIPGFALLDFGIRGYAGLQLAGLFSSNNVGITFTTTAIWFINLILPAITGSLLMLGLKLFSGKK